MMDGKKNTLITLGMTIATFALICLVSFFVREVCK